MQARGAYSSISLEKTMRTKGTAGPLALAFVCAALAGAAPAGAAESAARVSVLQAGRVLVRRAGAKTLVAARLNEPLIAGDTFATTDRDTRAEIQLDGFTDLRLGGGVDARILDNDSRARRVELSEGSIELALLRGQSVASEIVAPSFTLRAHSAGAYRVSIQSDGSASITPRSGQADVITGGNTVTIRAGNTFVVHGSAGDASVESTPAVARDSFDEFNAQRDRTLLAALSDPKIPAGIAGYDDLSSYGHWATVTSYGRVWVPDGQSAGWAPYRDGAWSYIGNDGWTWIGSEPWAWVPYHYGRWVYSSGYAWCWYPPPAGFNPVWAPFEPYLPRQPVRYGPPPHHPDARSEAGAGIPMAPVAVPNNAPLVERLAPIIRPAPIVHAAPVSPVVVPLQPPVIAPRQPPVVPVVRPPEPSHAVHSSLPHPPA